MAVTDAGSTSLSFTNIPVGIQVTKITDTSADWASVANSTYFYDKGDKLVHYKNSSGVVLELFSAAGGITYFTEAENTSAPNGTVYVDSLTAAASSTNADFAIRPKGTGAIVAAIPDNLTSGGNKRGEYAVDWQLLRNANTQVASGNRSAILGGYNNIASGTYSLAFGNQSSATNDYSIAIGQSAVSSGNNSISLGYANTASNTGATALGYSNTSNAAASFSAGDTNTASASRAISIGQQSTASGINSVAVGKSNTSSSSSTTALGDSNIASAGNSTAIGKSNIASGSATTAIGISNTSAGYGSATIGNSNSTAYDFNYAFGSSNTLTSGPLGNNSYVFAFGFGNTVNAGNAVAIGSFGLTDGVQSRQTFSPGRIATNGDAQKSTFFYRGRTTDATLTTLATDGNNSINRANCMQLPLNSSFRFKGSISGKQSGSINIAAWDVDGLIVKGASHATTTLVVSNVNLVSNIPAWGTPILSAYIDAFNGVGGLRIQIQGAVGTNIQWTAIVETTEVIYA